MALAPKATDDPKIAGKVVEGHIRNEQIKVDRGAVGAVFGSKDSVPANVAAIIATLSTVCLLLAVLNWAGSQDFSRKDGISAVLSLVTLTVGFLFGRATKG
jgi:hypothetical protein